MFGEASLEVQLDSQKAVGILRTNCKLINYNNLKVRHEVFNLGFPEIN